METEVDYTVKINHHSLTKAVFDFVPELSLEKAILIRLNIIWQCTYVTHVVCFESERDDLEYNCFNVTAPMLL